MAMVTALPNAGAVAVNFHDPARKGTIQGDANFVFNGNLDGDVETIAQTAHENAVTHYLPASKVKPLMNLSCGPVYLQCGHFTTGASVNST